MMMAMIFAAGRGERMRPLTDHTPKPLLELAGKPLIVWHIEKLAQAGFKNIVINHAWLGEKIERALGDGSHWQVSIRYSREHEALETAGGIAYARELLFADGKTTAFVCVSADIYSTYDYRQLIPRVEEIAAASVPKMHLVMVSNPTFNPQGDFVLNPDGYLALDGGSRLTFANIGVYDLRTFAGLTAGTHQRMRPFYEAMIAARHASGEFFTGPWENIGTPSQLRELEISLLQSAKPE